MYTPCVETHFLDKGTKQKNLFKDNIAFNPETKIRKSKINLDCIELTKLIYKNYYKKRPKHGHLDSYKTNDEGVLFNLISAAHYQLKKVTNSSHHQHSVFFSSDEKYKHKVMLKAYIIGVLSYILKHVDPSNKNSFPDLSAWDLLLRK